MSALISKTFISAMLAAVALSAPVSGNSASAKSCTCGDDCKCACCSGGCSGCDNCCGSGCGCCTGSCCK